MVSVLYFKFNSLHVHNFEFQNVSDYYYSNDDDDDDDNNNNNKKTIIKVIMTTTISEAAATETEKIFSSWYSSTNLYGDSC